MKNIVMRFQSPLVYDRSKSKICSKRQFGRVTSFKTTISTNNILKGKVLESVALCQALGVDISKTTSGKQMCTETELKQMLIIRSLSD